MRSNVLLLQGPVGPFFKWFAQDLESNGFNVFKINFNGGDRFHYPLNQAYDFTGYFSDWESYLVDFLANHNIGRIYLFGDCRSYHKVAKKIAKEKNVRLFVFEEGYIRPNFITLEEAGVNGHSSLIDKDIDYRNSSSRPSSNPQFPKQVFRNMVVQAVTYYLASTLSAIRFPNYVHHRPLNPLREGGKWLLSVLRKVKYTITERKMGYFLARSLRDKYFLCPLQVHCDMQISAHSGFTSVEHFIGTVVESFARRSDDQLQLVFKHHPMDRGYTDYTTLIKKLAHEYGLENRLHYVHDLDLPSLLKGARGTVLINSTVGMSSLHHDTPVKTLGSAIYNRPELTSQSSLDDFWQNCGEVNRAAYSAFRNYLISRNQINGSFYRSLGISKKGTGLVWSKEMYLDHVFTPNRIDSPNPPKLSVVPWSKSASSIVSNDILKSGKLASGSRVH